MSVVRNVLLPTKGMIVLGMNGLVLDASAHILGLVAQSMFAGKVNGTQQEFYKWVVIATKLPTMVMIVLGMSGLNLQG